MPQLTVQPEMALLFLGAALVMKERGLQRIPIVDQGEKPIGIIYARDALQHLLGQSEIDEGFLRDYVMSVGYQ